MVALDPEEIRVLATWVAGEGARRARVVIVDDAQEEPLTPALSPRAGRGLGPAEREGSEKLVHRLGVEPGQLVFDLGDRTNAAEHRA
jgi:hypothetical protein